MTAAGPVEPIQLYNTLARAKQPFVPANPGEKRRALKSTLLASARLPGLLQQEPASAIAALSNAQDAAAPVNAAWVDTLVDQRNQARACREFDCADDLRDQLLRADIVLEDKPEGTRWYSRTERRT